jgi:GABA permease
LNAAVQRFQPDQLVIAEARASWLRLGLVDKARAAYRIPLTHVVPRRQTADLAAAPVQAT